MGTNDQFQTRRANLLPSTVLPLLKPLRDRQDRIAWRHRDNLGPAEVNCGRIPKRTSRAGKVSN